MVTKMNNAESRQKLSGNKMICRHANKFSPSVYALGDKVLVKLKISDKIIKGEHKTFDIN